MTERSACKNYQTFICSQDGYLFDKEAILEYIIKQKKELARKQKEYEKQKNREKVRTGIIKQKAM